MPPKVYILDDDLSFAKLLMVNLRGAGTFKIEAFQKADDLFARRAEEPPDAVITDLRMPNTDGIEVTRAVRGHEDPALRDVPIVLITSQAGAENTAVGFAAGVTDYLTKPFRPAHVRARVQAWLLRRRSGPGGA